MRRQSMLQKAGGLGPGNSGKPSAHCSSFSSAKARQAYLLAPLSGRRAWRSFEDDNTGTQVISMQLGIDKTTLYIKNVREQS